MTVARSTQPAALHIGDAAPDFTLLDQFGNPITLSSFRGRKPVVLFFYPAAFSAGCTREACAFRDSHEVFKEAGAEVIGISTDSVDTQNSFAARYKLTYTLLSDSEGDVQRAFGVPKWLGVLRGRVTYVIDADGIVRHIFNSQVMINSHITEALQTLHRL